MFPPQALRYLDNNGPAGWQEHIFARQTVTAAPLIAAEGSFPAIYPVALNSASPTPLPVELLPFAATLDPQKWQWMVDSHGYIALVHREIAGCRITQTGGRGLSPEWRVEHSWKTLGQVKYSVHAASHLGQLRFVNYCDGGLPYGCLQVEFQRAAGEYIRDAEAVITTYQYTGK